MIKSNACIPSELLLVCCGWFDGTGCCVGCDDPLLGGGIVMPLDPAPPGGGGNKTGVPPPPPEGFGLGLAALFCTR